jgi:hypothetical protein
MKKKDILRRFIGKEVKIENTQSLYERLTGKTVKLMPELHIGNKQVQPIYFAHIEAKLFTQKSKQDYRTTGRIEFGNGWLIITDFADGRRTDGDSLFFAYYESLQKGLSILHACNEASENMDYVFWKANKIINGNFVPKLLEMVRPQTNL